MARRMRAGEVLAYRARDEEDEDDRGRDPEGAIEIRIALQRVQEGSARIQGGETAGQNRGGVDVEELGVKGESPEEALGGGGLVR